MITHMLAFKFRDDLPAGVAESVLAELDTFPQKYPAMRNWRSGVNVSTRDTTMTHGFVVEFATEQELLDYLHSESHERFVRERWRPVVERQVIVSLPTAGDA
ncbi:Dabb family protein [Solwaraspora sp. WMMD791]|uniref:Dabb family protein n=1 Tax=unclassified Solwaraspora TaxID=2627926 RepID=UPI00249C4445|nr:MULTISPECIES: Dabb family protein [unclassified Solwaraspora]WFE29924.1 Dabb family protein [Solwaraspora sp. WMMD791]WJK43233.1 Dabb family protein [Solwaraspora sp. WMMA2056]